MTKFFGGFRCAFTFLGGEFLHPLGAEKKRKRKVRKQHFVTY
jgi:hypothetical protein